VRRSCDADGQRGYKECASFVLAASIAAVLNLGPVLGPLLAPFKGQAAAHTGFRFKTILNFGYAGHGAIVGESYLIHHTNKRFWAYPYR
jgi:hypothetical protein